MKKKILYLITKSAMGGAQRYVLDLATNLPEGFEPVVACGPGGELTKRLEERKIKVIQIPSLGRDIFLSRDIDSFFRIISVIKKEKPDILHLNSSKSGFLGALAGRLLGVKRIVFTGHGWAFNEERTIVSKIIFAKIHWLTMLLSDAVIAVSRKTARDVEKFLFVQKKIHQIYNGIGDVDFFSKEIARNKISAGTSAEVWIGTISELHKNKGVDYIIKALRKIKDTPSWKFFIIGSGEEEKRLKELIYMYGLKEKIVLCGQIFDAARLLKAFDIFTLTSRTEAFPYALLEAGKAELSVTASGVGGILEVIEDGKSGMLVKSGDIDAIAKKLSELISDKSKRDKLGTNLKEKIESHFSLEKMVSQTTDVYTGN
ncbi:MAG: hypothetical protein A3E94_03645 [Candidatus Zambryskibacteria bacterium RIFCSPHIGHO2_12_FULL_44_12b]|uniref:Glycosyltransferase subfamily 4-like N-terminal domain-containing protein n=1 Tax=Candidatus Zambryskibacteria bacterium RIFCSPLOWO2_01_FULL_45_21 TaxID=1802761 RepID=A0A1G2U033_9BACT|nr:MAG: hypothetical protein A3E94_03645 [Candidatus Zambryskibacteria bacterium RIFCSPHIGHO2_12_FULL_44_12b]OHB02854.1 MAG: hypothetical protein A3B14_02355 [Candidatus Zambryskibacteria bacterium RIFCSPLOWO2_01_FULL_45_21]